MLNRIKFGLVIFFVAFAKTPFAYENIELSGFARLVGGLLDTEDVSYLDYNSEFKLGNDSLIALQASTDINNSLSATAQLIYHSGPHRNSGVEWAYLTYKVNNKLKVKAGKLRTPFFSYSDVIDVGFAYPWLTPPKQVYQPFVFSNFMGANISYNFTHNDIGYYLEGYWGQFDDTTYVNGEDFKTKVDDLRGLIANINIANLSFRISYHIGDVAFQQQELNDLSKVLSDAGFHKSANSIGTYGDIQAWQAGLGYDALNYFARFEFMNLSSDLLTLAETTGYYITLGYNLYPFTFHFTFADHNSDFSSPLVEIPYGVTPQLDVLYQSYNDVFDYLNTNDVRSGTIGMRWDYLSNLSFKFDVTQLSGQLVNEQQSLKSNQNNRAWMLKAGVEWIF